MKFKSLVIVSFCVVAFSARADFAFTETFDGFIDGSKASANIKDRNTVPVAWTDEAYTKIVRLSDAQKLLGLSALTEKKNPKISNVSIARPGGESSALLFYYRAGKDSWSEQRFWINKALLGRQGLEEVWLQYDIYIPDNLKLVDQNPTSGQYLGGGMKVLALYADAYSYPNTTFILGAMFSRKNSAGLPQYDNHVYNMSSLSWYKDGARIYENYGVDSTGTAKWVDGDIDRGSWQRRTVHFKFPTKDETSALPKRNGIVEVWIKRHDGTILKLIDSVAGAFYGDKNYFNGGYLNGYNNDGFEQETNILIDNVIITENSEAIDKTAIIGVARPLAPSAKVTD